MGISFSVKEFAVSLANVCGVVSSKNTMPILSNVCVEVISKDACILMASDGEIWLSVRASLLSGDVGLRFCVDALDFLKVLRNLGDIEVNCDVNIDKSTLTCVHPTGNFILPCLGVNDFPKPVELGSDIIGDTSLKLSAFNSAINAVRFCTAEETLRPTLNGVNVVFGSSGMTTVATDGNRLARYFDENIIIDGDFSFILPKKAIQSLLLFVDDIDVHIRLDNRVIVVECYDFKMTSRLIEGRYPNYNSVIPQSSDLRATFAKNDVITALRRVIPLGNNTSQLTTISFTADSFTIESCDIDFNKSGREFVECNYNGENLTIGFKGSSLVDVFTGVPNETITMELTDASHACVAHGGNRNEYLSVLMPMLID